MKKLLAALLLTLPTLAFAVDLDGYYITAKGGASKTFNTGTTSFNGSTGTLVTLQNEDLGAVLGIFNALSEHADTRNWQSLPNRIYYIRIPLREGENSISISISPINGLSKEQTIKIEGRKGIQFKRITTLRSF